MSLLSIATRAVAGLRDSLEKLNEPEPATPPCGACGGETVAERLSMGEETGHVECLACGAVTDMAHRAEPVEESIDAVLPEAEAA